ncbi:MAG: family 78 glycoside hydrolase catalytic domain [Verrucomicrobiia bacterium]
MLTPCNRSQAQGRRLLFAAGFWLTVVSQSVAAVTVDGLRCDYAVNPLGVDSPHPRLFWILESRERGQRQSAYQILAASSPKNLADDNGDLWDSGKVDSGETIQIPYRGVELKSAQPVFWKVRAWDAGGKVSAWSRPATWTMGVLADSDWRARWISAPDTNFETLLLRREFTVKPGLQRALVNLCGLGQYELSLDGKRAGDDLLAPGWSKYDRTCLYDTRDVTQLLHPGKNAAGIFLAGGMYDVRDTPPRCFIPPGQVPYSFGPLQAIAQLRLEYADGSVEIIGTDESWRVAPGPITFSSIYNGEDFDARLVAGGWDQANFNDSKWRSAQSTRGPGGTLRGLSCAAPPIRTFEVLKPVSTRQLTNGARVYDLGQNASLMPRIVVKGPAGAVVRIVPSELVKPDGRLDDTMCGGKTRWTYTLNGTGAETWFPKFFYRGARYLQVTCFPPQGKTNLPVVKSIVGVVIQSASGPVGEFQCSDDLFNRIHTLVRWAQRGNMMSLMTDCPQREKRGWLEEDHLNGPALRYEFDLAQLFTKQLNDMADSQLANGLVPTTAPEYTVFQDRGQTNRDERNRFGDSPEWGSAFILVPWQQYEFDGDLELFRRHYDAMKNYLAFLEGRANNHIVDYGLGDWYDIGPRSPGIAQLTPIALTATAFYFQDVQIMAQAAARLGQTNDARAYSERAGEIRAAFNDKFYNPTHRSYATGSQCANSIPLVMGLCDPTNRAAVLDAVVRDVRARGNALTAGDVGYRYLLRALADGGRSDVIFEINHQSDKPGYGFQLKKGATSLTEAWNAGRTSSQNHFMLGQILEWFYHDLAGIRNDPAGAGFEKILIQPQPVGDLTWARAQFISIRGKIVSDWKRRGDQFTLKVSIPANTTATVMVPARSSAVVTEGGKPASLGRGVKFLREEDGCAVFETGSGDYDFESRL